MHGHKREKKKKNESEWVERGKGRWLTVEKRDKKMGMETDKEIVNWGQIVKTANFFVERQ